MLVAELTVSVVTAMPRSRKTTAILALLALTLASKEAAGGKRPFPDTDGYPRQGWGFDTGATPGDRITGVNYLSPDELEVLKEVNLLRRDPAGYARLRLEPLRACYLGKLFFHPGATPVPLRTREGVAALDECIRVLENAEPAPPLSPSDGLSLAARELTREQGATTRTGHVGSHGSTMPERIERYGQWRSSIAENISYGLQTPREIIAFLLIDDGVSNRGHRKNLLNGTFNRIGISIGPHRRHNAMCVMDFAAGYTTKKR